MSDQAKERPSSGRSVSCSEQNASFLCDVRTLPMLENQTESEMFSGTSVPLILLLVSKGSSAFTWFRGQCVNAHWLIYASLSTESVATELVL